MNNIYNIILISHITCGFAALGTGLIAMWAKKSGKLHRISGKIYFWSMTGVAITSFSMCILKPNPFLFLITILSYFSVIIGLRALYLKSVYTGTLKPSLLDWIIGLVPVFLTIGLQGPIYMYNLSQKGMEYINTGLSVWLIINSVVWLSSFSKPKAIKQYWVIAHFQGMGGGYIATTTAFLVTNVDFLHPVVVWVSPGIIGGVIMSVVTKKYIKKFSLSNKIHPMPK